MIEQLTTKEVYKNPWMRVREDDVKFPNGHKGIYGVVEKPDFSLIIPFENNGFHLVKQYRYPVKNSFWEFPQGVYEENLNDSKLGAITELRQETGLTPKEIEEIGFLYESYGHCDQGFYIFFARNFTKGKQELEKTESDMVTEWFSEKDFNRMIDSGKVRDAGTVSAYCLFLRNRNKLLN